MSHLSRAAVVGVAALAGWPSGSMAGGKHHQRAVVVQQAPVQVLTIAQAPTYVAAAPTYYQAPAQAPVVYQMTAQAPAVTGQAPPGVGKAPGDDDTTLGADERKEIVEELIELRQDLSTGPDKLTGSERRARIKEQASTLVVATTGQSEDSLYVKGVVRSIVSEVMGGSPSPNPRPNVPTGQGPYTGYPQGYGYPGYYPAPMPFAFAPIPYVLIPIGPVVYAPAPKHCVHNLFHPCARCRGY